jgi:hypothetical protein
MGFGIVEPKTAAGDHIPGTATLFDYTPASGTNGLLHTVKHGKGRSADIVLVPQPSDSPNDPLVSGLYRTARRHCPDLFARIGRDGSAR